MDPCGERIRLTAVSVSLLHSFHGGGFAWPTRISPIRRAARFAWGVGFWDPRAGPRGVALARRLGLRTAVYTVNDERRMRELLALGVDGIFTDRPELLLALVRA